MALLTVKEVADYLRISVSMVYKEISAGRLPHYRLGVRVRISEEGLDAYLRSQHVEPESLDDSPPTSHLDL